MISREEQDKRQELITTAQRIVELYYEMGGIHMGFRDALRMAQEFLAKQGKDAGTLDLTNWLGAESVLIPTERLTR